MSEYNRMKSVLISTQPKWVEKICHEIGKEEAGKPIYEKSIEVRKTAPKEVPFKCYIYMSQGDLKDLGSYSECIYKNRMKVIGEFICDKVYSIKNQGNSFVVENEEQGVTNEIARKSCLDYDDMVSYFGNKDGYGWHISDLKIYDKPKELSEFRPIYKFDGKDAICALFCPNWKYDGGLFFECTRKVDRPPQSYMYVKELE